MSAQSCGGRATRFPGAISKYICWSAATKICPKSGRCRSNRGDTLSRILLPPSREKDSGRGQRSCTWQAQRNAWIASRFRTAAGVSDHSLLGLCSGFRRRKTLYFATTWCGGRAVHRAERSRSLLKAEHRGPKWPRWFAKFGAVSNSARKDWMWVASRTAATR